MCLFVRSGSHVAAVADLCWDNSIIPLRLKCGPEKSSFEGLSGPYPCPYPSNQKRIETPLPLDVNVKGEGLRSRNGIGLVILILTLYHFLVFIQLAALGQGQKSLCFIDIISGQFSVNALVKIPQIVLQLWDFYK